MIHQNSYWRVSNDLIKAIVKGERPEIDSIKIKVDEIRRSLVCLTVCLCDKEGNELFTLPLPDLFEGNYVAIVADLKRMTEVNLGGSHV